jgi:ubiquinone/menaquinone biosynthesis C-methylase UbiE
MVKAAAEPVSQTVTPEAITKVATGFMAAKQLFTASGLGLFAQLGGGPLPLAQLAERCGIPVRSARILADAMVALGFAEKAEAGYANRPVAQSFLAGDPEEGLRPFLSFWDQISYPAWMNLEDAARTGTGVGLQLTEAQQRVFSAGVQALTAGAARSLAGYDLGRHRHVLDVGGGTGSFLAAMLSAHPRLEGTLFELPAAARVARDLLTGTAVADRITVVEGDFLRDQLPSGHDLLLIANIIHCFQPKDNRELLGSLRKAVEVGARALLVDFWTDPTHTQPLFAALMAAEFLVIAGGDVYSAAEVQGWLAETGWTMVDQRPLAGPAGLIVAEAM